MPVLDRVARLVMLTALMILASVTAGFADDWQAVKLRGAVFVLQDNAWQQIERGDVVSDDRIIRTSPNARVQFVRGQESIDLGPNTQIRIFDRDGEQYTVVQQHFGEVSVEAERRNVQHFEVQTRFVAAVVKGTRFTVSADGETASVKVMRGQVEVHDKVHKRMVNITPGQIASAGAEVVLKVSGQGVLPVVVDENGVAVTGDDTTSGDTTSEDTSSASSSETVVATNSPNENANENAFKTTTVDDSTSESTKTNNAGGNSNGAGNSENSNAGGKNK